MQSTPSKIQRLASRPLRRSYHDIVTSNSPKRQPAIQHGPPGRSAISGQVVTVFGCTGFLGRYLVAKLAKAGTQVVVPFRDEDEKRHLKVMGDLGQIVPLEWDLRNEQQTAECLRHSDIVYNLVGRNYETKNFNFNSVHVTGAKSIAHIARESGVSKFIHVSHLNASLDSTSEFYRSKAEGEIAVREAFPDATVVRPAAMFGYEDRLLNNMAVWSIWWKLNHAQTKIRPVHVMDVAQALNNLAQLPVLAQTLNLPGPSTVTYEYLLDLIAAMTYRPPSRAPTVPKAIALALSKASQNIWWPTLSPDEIERRYIDDSQVQGDWDAVGVAPEDVEPHAITYLRRYRSAENYPRPVVFPESRPSIN